MRRQLAVTELNSAEIGYLRGLVRSHEELLDGSQEFSVGHLLARLDNPVEHAEGVDEEQ